MGAVHGTEGSATARQGITLEGKPIPPQLLTEIFLRIDCRRTIGFTCPLVCRRWRDVLTAPGFWMQYMKFRNQLLPPPCLRTEPLLNVKKVCLLQPFGRNLIANPSGERQFDGWTVLENHGDRLIIETPPVNCDSQFEDSDIETAFVTSYAWGKLYYVVDLWKSGIEANFLNVFRPPITVSTCFNCRRDCAAMYMLDVELVPNGQEPQISHERPVIIRRDRFHRPVRMRRRQPEGDNTTPVSVTRVFEMPQWSEAKWQRVEHTFNEYPQGIRYVVFEHSGKDMQFWAGHYGAKMARACVMVGFGDGVIRNVDAATCFEAMELEDE